MFHEGTTLPFLSYDRHTSTGIATGQNDAIGPRMKGKTTGYGRQCISANGTLTLRLSKDFYHTGLGHGPNPKNLVARVPYSLKRR